MKVLFVGAVSGYTSYPVVCKGIIQALAAAGLELIIIDTTWDGSPDHTMYAPQLRERLSWLDHKTSSEIFEAGHLPEGLADVAFALNPTHQLVRITESGLRMGGMFVGDVDIVPESWASIMRQLDVVLTPSTHMKTVIQNSNVDTPVIVVPHGISPVFVPPGSGELVTELNDEGPFLFLHPCSESFFPERKGTPQVLQAFIRLVDEGYDVVLKLLFGMKSKPIRQLLQAVPSHVRPRLQIFLKAGARPQDEIRNAYLSAHALLAPSRAEGFGMIPLEARACGVPVVQTLCTGHEDHLDPDLDPADWGIVVVPHGEMMPAWGKFGRAPSVDPHDVKVAMIHCMEHWDALHRSALDRARSVGNNWSWTEGTKPLLGWLRQ